MTLSEIDTESQYDPKHKAFTITTHHTGSSASRHNSPAMRMGTPPVDCGSPPLASPAKPSDPNRLSQFDFSPLRAFRTARQSFLPSYHSNRPASSIYSRTTSGEPARKFWQRKKAEDEEVPRVPEISYPLNVNPQFAHLVKPNLAHHPSVRRGEEVGDKI
jgi:hypothetical protein